MTARAASRVLVAGDQGVVGRGFIDHVANDPTWSAIGISRRTGDATVPSVHLSLDLTDAAECRARSDAFAGVTHLVYCAVVEGDNLVAGWSDQKLVATNAAMLANVLDAIESASDRLTHVTVLQGTKAYGIHLGQIDIPARERDPRHPAPNFYHEQEDLLRQRQPGSEWTWTIWRPQTVIGFSAGSPMNILTSIAVYSTLMKELGLPLRFPGQAWTNIWQAIDTRLLAKAIAWGGRSPFAANQAFNITNGDCVTWRGLWPAIARVFAMEHGSPQNITLARALQNRDEMWSALVERYGLANTPLSQLCSWQFADFGFNGTRNSYVSTIKLRKCGFDSCIDTEQMFVEWFAELRRRRVIPDLEHQHRHLREGRTP